MIRWFILLFASVCFAGAPQNSLTVTVQSAETGHPVTFGRPFAQGEIAAYPKPLVNGTAPTYWQADQVSRYRDGVASCTITAVANTSAPTVTCASHGFWSGDQVRITGANLAALNGTHYVVYRNRNEFVLPRLAAAPGVFTGTATVTGPGPGSVKWARISYISNSQNQTVTFADNPYRTSDPAYQSPTKAQILAFNAGNWNAGMTFSATGATDVSRDAKTMINADAYWLWADGPALWEVVVEDRSTALAYDFEFACATNCTWSDNHSTSTWSNGSRKQVHPRFVLKMYRDWAGVGIEYLAENTNFDLIGDVYFSSVVMKSGAALGTTEETISARNLWAEQRWLRGPHWDGTTPSTHSVGKNLAYLSYTKQVPNYARNITITTGDVDGIVAAYPPGGGAGDLRGWTYYMPASGGVATLGPNPYWYVVWLYSADSRLDATVRDIALSAGAIPWHRRETASNRAYLDLTNTGDANGQSTTNNNSFFRPFSVETRPTYNWDHDFSGGDTHDLPASWGVLWGSGAGTGPGITIDILHPPEVGYIPYLLTGDLFYLEEVQFEASYQFSWAHPGYGDAYGRNRYLGLQHIYQNDRGTAWALRGLLYAAAISPDGSLEQEYYRRVTDRTFQIWDGWHQKRVNGFYLHPKSGQTYDAPCGGTQTNSSFDRAVNTPSCWGQSTWYSQEPGFLGEPSINMDSTWDDWCMYCTAHRSTRTWMRYYLYMMVGIAEDLGWKVRPMLDFYARFPLQFQTPESNRYLCCVYQGPVWMPWGDTNQAGPWPNSPKEYFDMYDSTGKAKNFWNVQGNDPNWGSTDGTVSPDGYSHLFRSATSYMTEAWQFGIHGWSMWDNIRNDTVLKPYYDAMSFGGVKDPRFAFEPRPPTVKVQATSGDTFVILEYTKPRADEACTVGGVSDGVTSSRLVRVVKTGLAPSSSGTLTLACASDPFGNTSVAYTTLSTLSGTAAYTWTATGGNTRLNYGATEALGSSTVFQDCSGRCSATLAKGLWYVQVERQSGAAGEIRPVLIR